MLLWLTFFCVLSLSFPSFGREVSSRSVFRSGDEGAVNLVEFNVRGTIFGKCGFRSEGEEMSIIFEEKDGEMKAEATNPTILDPKSKVEICRVMASQSPVDQKFRAELNPQKELSSQDILRRFAEFDREIASNQNYLSYIEPKIFSLLSALGSSNSYGISFGSIANTTSYFPSFGISLPQYTASQATVGLGFPFKTSMGKKR